LKKYIFSIALSLAVVLVLGTGTALLACGNGCTTAKSGDCGPCPMASADASSKVQAQTAKAAPCPATCQGDPAKCPNPDCLKQGKGCEKKCSMGDAKSNCKASSADNATKQGSAKVKTVKAVEAKAQTVSNPKNNS
jgi:hypothetical protein